MIDSGIHRYSNSGHRQLRHKPLERSHVSKISSTQRIRTSSKPLVLSVLSAQQSLEHLTFVDQKLGSLILSPEIRYFSDKDLWELLGACRRLEMNMCGWSVDALNRRRSTTFYISKTVSDRGAIYYKNLLPQNIFWRLKVRFRPVQRSIGMLGTLNWSIGPVQPHL
jgi:hypothetical protein